jgi:transketolase
LNGITFIRTDREKRPVIYDNTEEFPIGGSKTLFESDNDTAVVFSSGITLHEAMKAHDILKGQEINIAVVDLYSIKPIDAEIINDLAEETQNVIVVEDHYPAGGIGEAVKTALTKPAAFYHLAVTKTPRSGTSEELLRYEEIDAQAIVDCVKRI